MEYSISAVVPIYNVECYLDECLDSIVKQTVPFSEVILINDGSTDGSQKICEKYCKQYDYISLINQKNAGQSEARNVGIKAAKSDYIVFIDSDDYIRHDMVEKLTEEIKKNSYDILFFSASVQYDDCDGESASYYTREDNLCEMDMRGSEFFVKSFPSNYIVSPCLAAYRRKVLENNKIYFERGILFEDNDFFVRICLLAEKVRCIKEAFYVRRYHTGSTMTGLVSKKKCEDLIKINELIWKTLERSCLERSYLISIISYYLIHTWDVISESEYLHDVQEKWEKMSQLFDVKWRNLYLSNTIDFSAKLALYLMLSENDSVEYEKIITKMRSEIETELITKLKKIPLDSKDKVIGVYGIGKHTEKLLSLYKKYIGEIHSKLVFIVTTNKQNLATYQDRLLITCDKISDNMDFIIISSLKYQKDMIEILKKYNIDDNKIIRLYKNDDYCDWASVMRILG